MQEETIEKIEYHESQSEKKKREWMNLDFIERMEFMRSDRLEKDKLRSDMRELRRRLRMMQKPELNILRRVE